MDIAIQHISSFSIVCVSDFVNFELSYKGKDVHIAKRRRVRDAIDSTQTTVITTDMPTDDNDSNLSRYTRPSEDTHAPCPIHSHTRTHHTAAAAVTTTTTTTTMTTRTTRKTRTRTRTRTTTKTTTTTTTMVAETTTTATIVQIKRFSESNLHCLQYL